MDAPTADRNRTAHQIVSWFAQPGRETMTAKDVVLEVRQPTERELLFEEAHKRFKEDLERIDKMILEVVKAQIIVERFMISFLQAHGRDLKHFFFTAQKIKECKRIDPPEVGQTMWDLLALCSYVRNELVHSLDDEEIKAKTKAVRDAYLAATESERQRQGIRDMNDTQMVTSALYDCGSHIAVATMKLEEEQKKKG
jgi:hypothetical protein